MAAQCSARAVACSELERRIARTNQQIGAVRAELHLACRAVSAAERELLARRAEREGVALRLARLADLLESLERGRAVEQQVARQRDAPD